MDVYGILQPQPNLSRTLFPIESVILISHNYISIDLHFSPNHAPKYVPQEQEASTEAGTSALAPFISTVSLA